MEFALLCPNDGRIELGLEDISSVVIRDNESIEVVFSCPQCGTALRATMRVPEVLAAAVELERFVEDYFSTHDGADRQSASRDGSKTAPPPTTGRAEGQPSEAEIRAERERVGEPYCEYFRRQLSRVESVEDLLHEID